MKLILKIIVFYNVCEVYRLILFKVKEERLDIMKLVNLLWFYYNKMVFFGENSVIKRWI